MPCNHIDLGNGASAIVCTRGRSTKRCVICGLPGGKLCDFPLTGAKAGKTCDRSLCAKCAVHREPDIDYCPTHARMVEAEKEELR